MKYQPRMPDGSYYHKSKSGAAKMPWNRLTYDVPTKEQAELKEFQSRLKHSKKKNYLNDL